MKRVTIAMMVVVLAASGAARAGLVTRQSDSATFGTIQAAIDDAGTLDGETLDVSPGTYDEAIVIQKAVRLIGQDRDTTILTYTGATLVEQQIFLGSNTGFDFADEVAIENFSIVNGGKLFDDNDLIKFRGRGVGGQIVIRNNLFDGDGDGSAATAKGIEESQQASNFLITENTFENCAYGIWANSLQDGEISYNTFQDSSSGAIGMGGSGTGADAPQDFIVTKNTMDGGKYGMVMALNPHDITISCNAITNSTHTGILYWEYGTEDWTNMHINNNNIVGNAVGVQGVGDPAGDPPPTNPIDAESNWWGDASGPSGLGPGTGDSVLLNNVDFDPWLTAPSPCAPGGAPPIPEPGSAALGALGLALLAVRKKRN